MAEHGELLGHAGEVAPSRTPALQWEERHPEGTESTPPKSTDRQILLRKISEDWKRRREQCLMVAFSWSCRAPREPLRATGPTQEQRQIRLGLCSHRLRESSEERTRGPPVRSTDHLD